MLAQDHGYPITSRIVSVAVGNYIVDDPFVLQPLLKPTTDPLNITVEVNGNGFNVNGDIVLCIGDQYNIIQKDNQTIIIGLSLTQGVAQISGSVFTDVQIGCLVSGEGLPDNTRVQSVNQDKSVVTLTKPATKTITTDITFVYYTYKVVDKEFRFDVLYTAIDLYKNPEPTKSNPTPDPDPRNDKLVFDLSLGKLNLVGTDLYIVTKINIDTNVLECLVVDLATTTPSFSKFEIPYTNTESYTDISVIE